MLNRFMPREGKFFELFKESAEQIVLGCHELRKLLHDLPNADTHANTIKEIEHRGDTITHTTVALLHQTFVTPLDREDIHNLINKMDDILDFAEACAERVSLYEIKKIPASLLRLADVVVLTAENTKQAVEQLDKLKNPEEIIKICVEINRLENEADYLLRKGTAELFKEENDIKMLLKLKEIYEILETVTDCCEDVANIIEGIVLEYA